MFSMTGEYMYLTEAELEVRLNALINKKGLPLEDAVDVMVNRYPRQEGDILLLAKQKTGDSVDPSMFKMIQEQLGMIADIHKDIQSAIDSRVNLRDAQKLVNKVRGLISVVEREVDLL